ncbi:thiol-activated cytolysin family protein [Maribacter sp. 2307UL18-2]|uniref:thiol-activated cytolysin family protein n=1 Tax=Maribacter sp. 2307UL18-2 TaxID=3386274 RepID=UPI0039BC9BF1
MKTQNRFFSKLITFTLILLGLACSKDDPVEPGPGPTPEVTTFEDVIKLGGDTESFPTSRNEVTKDTLSVKTENPTETNENGENVTKRYICTKRSVSVTDGNGEFPLFDTNAEVIFPGALLQGKTLNETIPAPIVVKRAGGTISYNLNDGNAQSFFKVDEVKKSSIQNGMNRIIAGSQALPDNFALEIFQVESEKELALEMGIKVETFASKVKSNMSFSSGKSYNRTLVKLTQKFYDMSFDLPTSLDEIFDESVTPENLATYVQADNPATFISSVVYGRIFYMLVESTSSRQEMEAKLSATYEGVTVGVSGEVKASALEELKDVKIKVIAYGGNGSSKLVGETNIQRIAELLDETNDIRSGLPLSYVVRSVERPDKVVGTNISTELEVVDCELKGTLPPESYLALVDLFDDGIGAAAQIEGPNAVFYNKAGTKYAWYNVDLGQVLGVFDIKDPSGPLGVSSFDSVGAAVNIADGKIHIYDETGLLGEIFSYKACNCNGTEIPTILPIGAYNTNSQGENIKYPVNSMFGDSPFPFAGDGFIAASRYFENRSSDGANIVHFFGKPGNEYAGYYGDGTWADKNDVNNWGDASQTHFERIGAACRIAIGGNSNIRQLFFNQDGTEFTIWNPLAQDSEKEFSAPWVIN